MTKPNKWFRRAFLGSVALSVMATGAQADELEALKAQLEALQSRVNQIETTAPAGTSPSGAPQSDSWITFHRGSDIGWDQQTHARPQEYIPEDRGFTIAITPTADLPAPVHEVTVSGYVKGDFIFDTHQDLGDSFNASTIDGGGDREHVRLHARQSRFRIKSRSDTAVGEVRTLIEGDFEGAGGNEIFSNSTALRLRHAWGEWDLTPNTTIGVGQTWTNFMNLFAYPDTVDFFGPAGLSFARQGQVRLTYHDGPWLFAVAVENPETDVTGAVAAIDDDVLLGPVALDRCNESNSDNICGVNDNVPDVTARLQYDAPGGHKFQISGVLRNLRVDEDVPESLALALDESESELGWGVLGAASVNLADIATLTGTLGYGDGIGRYLINGSGSDALYVVTFNLDDGTVSSDLETIEALGASLALSIGVTDTTTLNVAGGYYDQSNSDILDGQIDNLKTVHVNLIWQPVSRFRMGVEGMWGEVERKGADDEDALRFQFGAWFFF